jgi:hypothetical protein
VSSIDRGPLGISPECAAAAVAQPFGAIVN